MFPHTLLGVGPAGPGMGSILTGMAMLSGSMLAGFHLGEGEGGGEGGGEGSAPPPPHPSLGNCIIKIHC